MTALVMDFERKARCGVEEAVLCEFKTVQQIDALLELAITNSKRLLLTRLSEESYRLLPGETRDMIDYNPVSKTAILGGCPEPKYVKQVVIVSGGASDTAVCHEVATTLKYHGIGYELIEDVGVAGLWRLMERLEYIRSFPLIIAVAGMEAALPTVLAGLTSSAIVAVPTSVGYGVSSGGELALKSCLGSCASGVATVNIDNGFGAACMAIKLVTQFGYR